MILWPHLPPPKKLGSCGESQALPVPCTRVPAAACSGAGEGGPARSEALGGQPRHLCTPDPMDFTAYATGGLEVGLGPAPFGCLRSSRGETHRPEPLLLSRASSWPNFCWITTCMRLKSFPCGVYPQPVAKGAPRRLPGLGQSTWEGRPPCPSHWLQPDTRSLGSHLPTR